MHVQNNQRMEDANTSIIGSQWWTSFESFYNTVADNNGNFNQREY